MTSPDRRHILLAAAGLAATLTSAPAAAAGKPQAPAIAGPSRSPPARIAFTEADLAGARPEGLAASVRIDGDDVGAFRSLLADARRVADPWLVMSGGGENGAFAAGLLAGWTKTGSRPEFGVVTGVSTGAMIAPFAFLGQSEDETLRRAYTEITAADIFEFGGGPDSLTDTWPLKRMIDRAVTPDLLRRIAEAQRDGRRLLVVTTEIDTGRPALWDMGAIAEAGTPEALHLFRKVILASAAIPAIFPPVLIDVRTEQGRTVQEMHADGGTTAPFYLAPGPMIRGEAEAGLPTQHVYVVVNTRATPEFDMAQRSVLSVLGRSMSAMIRAQTQAALALGHAFADRSGLALDVAQIDGGFTKTSPGPFDQAYMRSLYRYGEERAEAGKAFGKPAGPLVARATVDPESTGTVATPVEGQAAGAPLRTSAR